MAVEFHPLPVRVRRETSDAVSLSFDIPDDLRDTFRHVPGQHVILRSDIDGEDVRRSYSICSSVNDDEMRVGIKHLPGGAFSTYATSELRDGDLVDVMAPIGEFCHTPDRTCANSYVALAAGSGIRPILSMLTSILELEPSSRCSLVYGNRTAASIMFLEDLEALKNRFPDRFQIIHVLSREPHEVPLFEGRIDAEKLRSLASTLIDVPQVDAWFLCGPVDMVETARDTLVGEFGVDPDSVHQELFFDERIEIPEFPEEAPEDGVEMTFVLDGRSSTMTIVPDGPSLLDYARSVRSEVPFACKGGMCATCKAVVTSGEVCMEKNYALTPEEVDNGFVLTCQAHPVDGDITVSFDTHGGLGR